MSKRILVCNRGEIAIRIAKAINELGHIAIGFWTDNEPEPPHLVHCKEWLYLEGVNNSETYLDIDKIIKICVENKIDAVHPGYGFLAENANFALKLEKEEIVFIGPNPKAIELMGDKAVSKKIALKSGVPVIPGSTGEVASVKEAQKIAAEIGYPVLLKAVAGGGGKGMRVCLNEDELATNFDAVKRESLSSFGNDGLLVEKYILNPHHIEVQILADKNGNIYHLYDRECSIQRRHQKIIEEAPSPFIGNNQKLREEICQTAIKLAQAVDYDSAGTVEFVMGEDFSFYFLEMNTRIQVEHPITEEVTSIDLVSNMIKSALGESLDIQSQDEIVLRGHAIECRICAEDPVTMLPAPGVIRGFDFELSQGIRFDHCIYLDFEVKSDFDPMIGKLVSFGHHREVAIRKMNNALRNLSIEGLKTNIPLHKLILTEKNFVNGNYCTDYIGQLNLVDDIESMKNVTDLYKKAIAVELNYMKENL